MRALLLIAGHDLRSRLRDRSGLIQGIGVPLVLAVVISLAFGGGNGDPVRVALVDADESERSTAIADEVLAGFDEVEDVVLTEAADEAEARELIAAGEVGAAVVLPEGLAEALGAGPAPVAAAEGSETGPDSVAELVVVVGDSQPVAGAVAEGIAGQIIAHADQVAFSVAATIELGVREAIAAGDFEAITDPDAPASEAALDDLFSEVLVPPDVEDLAALGERAAEAPGGLVLDDDADAGARERLDAASYFGPSMAVLAALFVVTSAPRALIRERRQGTLQRLRAAPIPAWAPMAGLALSVALIGIVAMGVVLGVVSVALGAQLGDPVGLAALSLAVVLFAGALAALIASVVRTEQQADGLAAAVTFALAVLGGHFIELHALPDGVQTVALATPNGWAMRGYTALAADGAGVGEILLPIAVILGVAAVLALVALPGLRRQEA